MSLTRRSFLRSALLFLFLALALPATSCRETPREGWYSGGAAGLGLGDQPNGPLASEELAREAFTLARAVLSGGAVDARAYPRLSEFEGRRAFLTVYGAVHPPISTTGKGEDLRESVAEAARALRDHPRMRDAGTDGDFRLKLEVPTRAEKKRFSPKDGVLRHRRETLGLLGFYVEADGNPGWMTGTEIVENDVYDTKGKGLRFSTIRRRLEARSGGEDLPEDQAYMQFETEAWVEAPRPTEEPPVRLYRARPHPERAPEPTADVLLESAILAADYIERIIGEDGRQVYLYHSTEDRTSRSYNMLRHCGTVFALLQAYDRTKWPRYREAAERSLDYVVRKSRWEKRKGLWGDDFLFVLDYDDAKLGGAGLALIAMAQYTEATGDRRYWKEMQGYARFIVFMQRENGRMNSFHAWKPGMKVSDEENIFYPGEALLGLMRLHALEPDPLWLKTARKAADYMILERDKGKDERTIPRDHWLMYGLSYLYHFTKEPLYADHARLIARAMKLKARGPDHPDVRRYPDYLGAFYNPPQLTPGGTILEGLSAGVDLLKEAGDDYSWVMDILVPGAGFIVRQQFTPTSAYFLPKPEKVLGGIPESTVINDIRNDYVQHCLSALLGVERHLRAEQGVTVPGGPLWPEKLRQGATFAGIPERPPFAAFARADAPAAPVPAAAEEGTAER